MNLKGQSLIGFSTAEQQQNPFYAADPASDKQLEPVYFAASDAEVLRAAQLAGRAAPGFAASAGVDRARLLRAIAIGIEGLGDSLTHRACLETGLPEGRIRAETGRTAGQLRMFAELIEEGSWVDARIDRADPTRSPAPRPDVRSMLRPLGPVAVFGPNNFPLAFSVAGGDTASALGAGNPVIVVAHYAHPGTSELVGHVIAEAARQCGFPDGTFSLLFGRDHRVGRALLEAEPLRAVAFTGSFAGGEALRKIASARPHPVPFFAEMGSINPVLVLPEAMNARFKEIATGLHGSVTLGTGQFCTNPGLVLIPDSDASNQFTAHLVKCAEGTPESPMLTSETCASYARGVDLRSTQKDTKVLIRQKHASGAAVFQTLPAALLNNPELGAELFGPSTTLVRYAGADQLSEIMNALPGQLTASVHEDGHDTKNFESLLRTLEAHAGRVVYNAFPTGVEVCASMVHGGPYPATSDSRFSSVGTRSINRFVRPVCYQDAPEWLLPPELQDSNPCGISRLVEGAVSHNSLKQ